MTSLIESLNISPSPYVNAALSVLAFVIIAKAVSVFIDKGARRMARFTRTGFDDRIIEDGTTFALVVTNADPEEIGVIGYYPEELSGVYAMLVVYDEETYIFYMSYASDTEMYGRYWLLAEDDLPVGNGEFAAR